MEKNENGKTNKNSVDKSAYMPRQTAIWLALAMFVAGFVGGVVFGVMRTGNMPRGQHAAAVSPKSDHDMVRALEEEVSKNPQDTHAWNRLGNIYFDTDQNEKAIRAYEKSLSIEPGNPNVLTDLGVMYRRNKQPRKAVEAFGKAAAADPKHEVSRMNKGIVLLHDLEDKEAALQAWEELLEINPYAMFGNGQPLADQVKHYREHGDGDGAEP